MASLDFERPGVPPAGCDTRRPSLDHAETSSKAHPERWSLGRLGGFLFFSHLKTKTENRLRRANARPRLPAPPIARNQPRASRSVSPLRIRRASLASPPTNGQAPTAGRPGAPGTNRPTNRTPTPTAFIPQPRPDSRRHRKSRTRNARLRRPSNSALPARARAGKQLVGVGPCGPPTRERVPDENCFLVRRPAPEESSPRDANSPSGEIRRVAVPRIHAEATNQHGTNRYPSECRVTRRIPQRNQLLRNHLRLDRLPQNYSP